VRTRFDVWFDAWFDLTPFAPLAAHAAATGHGGLLLAQESTRTQSDVLLIAPLPTYVQHVARLIRTRSSGSVMGAGSDNGWGWGRHVRPSRSACTDDAPQRRTEAGAAAARTEEDDGGGQVSQGSLVVRRRALAHVSSVADCAVTVLEDYALPFEHVVRDNASGVLPLPSYRHRLGERVRIYCPYDERLLHTHGPRFEIVNKSWLPPFLREREARGVADALGHARGLWPTGC
jgi:hypothetical protein